MQEPRKGEIAQAGKRKNGNAEVPSKISNQLPFGTPLMNSGTDYEPLHQYERAKFMHAVLMSYQCEKMFTCMRQGAAVWLPGKNM